MTDDLDDEYYEDKWSDKSYRHLVHPRPFGIIILSIFLFILSILVFYIAYNYPGELLFTELFYFNDESMIFWIISYFSIIQIIVSIGLILGKKFAWIISFFLVIFNGILLGLIGIFIAILIVFYLTRPHVRDYFRRK